MNSKTTAGKQAQKVSNETSKPVQKATAIKTPVVQKPDPVNLLRRARMNPDSLTQDDIMQLQRILGNRAVTKLLSQLKGNKGPQEEKRGTEPKGEKEEKPVQRKEGDVEKVETSGKGKTGGMPGNLRRGLETLSGIDLSDVRVHRNSDKPQQVGALAYTQGRDIYVGPGQEQHLPHEAWHAVQQKQGRVQPTMQLKAGTPVNNDAMLEKEADIMGSKAAEAGKSGVLQKVSDKAEPVGSHAQGFSLQLKANNSGSSGPENKSATPPSEVVELKGMSHFTPPASVSTYLDSNKEGGKINVRYGNIATGSLNIKKSGKTYTISRQAIPLQHSLFAHAGGLQPCLVVSTTGEMLKGYMGISNGNGAPGPDDLKARFSKDPGLFGLKGLGLDKIGQMVNSIDGGVLKFGIQNARVNIGNVFSGSISLNAGPDGRSVDFSGTAGVSLKGLANGSVTLRRSPQGTVTGSAFVGLNLTPHFSGGLNVNLDGDNLAGEGQVKYAGGKLSGVVTMRLADKNNPIVPGMPSNIPRKSSKPNYAVAGEGDLTFAFTPWLNGNARVLVDEKGYVTIVGKITPQKEIELFPQKKFEKQLVEAKVKAAYGIPVIGDVYLFAGIGLGATAKLGPARLYNIAIGGTYSTDPEKAKDFTVQGSLNISASASLDLTAKGGVGLEILGHEIEAGAEVTASAGIQAYADATPIIGYKENAKPGEDKKGQFFIAGDLEIAAQPFLGLSGDLFIEVDAPWWSPCPDKKWKWPLFNKSYPIGGSFGISAYVEHILGSHQVPEIKFGSVDFDANKFLTDLVHDKTGGKAGRQDVKKGKWTEKNSRDAQPPAKTQAPKNSGGKKSGTPPVVSIPKPGKGGKREIDPKTKTADGKTVGQHQDAATKKGKNPKKNTGNKNNPNQERDEQLKKGFGALDELTAKYAKDGITREELEPIVKSVRRKYDKAFKSITVVDGGQTWDYKYVYNPEGVKKGRRKKKEPADEQLKHGLKALDELTAKYNGMGGATLKDLEPGVKSIRRKYGFKSINIVEGEKTWDYKYEPHGKKNVTGPKKKDTRVKAADLKESIKEFDIREYGDFKDYLHDGLTGHELLQNAWLVANGFGPRGGNYSAQNPAIALKEDPMHKAVSAKQRSLKMDTEHLKGVSWRKNVTDNIQFLREVGVPSRKIADLAQQTRRFAQTVLKLK